MSKVVFNNEQGIKTFNLLSITNKHSEIQLQCYSKSVATRLEKRILQSTTNPKMSWDAAYNANQKQKSEWNNLRTNCVYWLCHSFKKCYGCKMLRNCWFLLGWGWIVVFVPIKSNYDICVCKLSVLCFKTIYNASVYKCDCLVLKQWWCSTYRPFPKN